MFFILFCFVLFCFFVFKELTVESLNLLTSGALQSQFCVCCPASFHGPPVFHYQFLCCFQACASFKWTRDLAKHILSAFSTTPSPRSARSSTMEAAKGMTITLRVIANATRHVTKFPVSNLFDFRVLLGIIRDEPDHYSWF